MSEIKYDVEKIYATFKEIDNDSKSVKPYVIVCCPRRNLEETPAQQLEGIFGLHIDLSGFSHAYCNIGGEAVDVARNYLMEQAIYSGAKYMLFIGEDTVMPYDGFLRLHEIAEKNPTAMVAGVYYIKLSIPMIMQNIDGQIIAANVDPGQVYEAWMTGLDAMLIPIAPLKALYESDPENPLCCIAHKFRDIGFIGEDNYFIHRWRKFGNKLLVNTDVQCLHMDLASGKYTAHPDIDEKNYFTLIPLNGRLTMHDKLEIDRRWQTRLPHLKQTPQYKKLNLGCGNEHLEGYVNIDIQEPCDVNMDIHDLKYNDNSIEEIFSSHNLEHFPDSDVPLILREIYRVLEPNGKLRLIVPDLEYCVKEWLDTPELDENKWNFYLKRIFGAQTNEGEYHKTGFTEQRIFNLLYGNGFSDIKIERIDDHAQECLSIVAYKKVD